MTSSQLRLDVPLREPGPGEREVPAKVARLKKPNRDQLVMSVVDLERLIPAEHLARAIDSLVKELPDTELLASNKSFEGQAGRPRTDPRMLVAIWVYAYSQGMGEAEAIAEEMKYEPALRWLAGNQTLSARTLSGFRVAQDKAVRELFASLLGILSELELVDLKQVTLDGTKIKASAGAGSFRREKALREHIAEAELAIQQLEQPETAQAISAQRLAARQREAVARRQRLQTAATELAELQKGKSAAEQAEVRVSLTDPEARRMKEGNGGISPAYNMQLTTDVKHTIIVDVAVTQQGFDQQQLVPALGRLQQLPRIPGDLIVDGGYITAASIEAAVGVVNLIGPQSDPAARAAAMGAKSLQQAGIAPEYAGSAFRIIGEQMQCPAGKMMTKSETETYTRYAAKAADCRACAHRPQCCPKSSHRTVKQNKPNPVVLDFAARMKEEANVAIFGKRGPVAEFPNAWIKDKHQLRQFHVRGLIKVTTEAWWSALTYNIQQWFRLSWRPGLANA